MDFDSHGPALTVRTLYNELGTDKIEALCRNFYEGLYSDDKPEEQEFVNQFKNTPLELAIHNLHSYLVQKFGGDPFFGGMMKESSFVRNMHTELFKVLPEYVDMWLRLFTEAIDKTDLGLRKDEVKKVMLAWATGFGKTIVNNGCPHMQKRR